MSTEQGVVEQVEPGWAWVKAKRLGASSGCGRYDHCHTIGDILYSPCQAKSLNLFNI